MATGNEGPDLDLTLRALAEAMAPGDELLAFHSGDDATFDRLQRFAAERTARIFRTDSPVGERAELLKLALTRAGTEYAMLLGPTDRLQPEALHALRRQLMQEAPALCLIQSAWWLVDSEHPLPRSDSPAFDALPQRPAVREGAPLLADPRRLIFRAEAWSARLAAWPPGQDDKGFYARALQESPDLMVAPAAVLLHRHAFADPTPALQEFARVLEQQPRSRRAACLTDWMPLLDEQLALCSFADAGAVLKMLPQILAALPWAVRRGMARRPGAFARLLDARIREGRPGAKAELTLQISAEDQRRSDVLARAYGRLRQDLDLALPGPDYLRALYTRLRGL